MVPGHVDIANRIQSERKPARDANAYDLVLRANWMLYHDFASHEAVQLLEKALEIDPTYAVAHAKLAAHYAYGLFAQGLRIDEASTKTRRHGGAATKSAPGDALVHAVSAEAYVLIGEHALAAHHADKALSLNPNEFEVMGHAAQVKACLGDHEAGLELIHRALRNDPYSSVSFRENIFDINYIAGRYEAALDQLTGWPDPPLHMVLSKAAALAQLGRISEAVAEARRFEVMRPEDWDTTEIIHAYRRMCATSEDGDRWLEGFRKAGLPV
jgi:tetratricopeptide (TPR) repeat protein